MGGNKKENALKLRMYESLNNSPLTYEGVTLLEYGQSYYKSL